MNRVYRASIWDMVALPRDEAVDQSLEWVVHHQPIGRPGLGGRRRIVPRRGTRWTLDDRAVVRPGFGSLLPRDIMTDDTGRG